MAEKNYSDIAKYFGSQGRGIGRSSVPANARVFGMIIDDRDLKRHVASDGVRAHHIPFQYLEVIPTETKSANYDNQDIAGRFENLLLYKGSENSTFSITLKYYAEGTEKKKHKTSWTIEAIERYSRRCKSLLYPAYEGKYGPPNICKLNIGASLVDVPVKVRNISLLKKPPFDTKDLKSFFQEITMELVTSYPINQAVSAEEIERSTYDPEQENHSVFSVKRFNIRSARNR